MKKSLDSLAEAQRARRSGGGESAPRATEADADKAEAVVHKLASDLSHTESRAEIQRIQADAESGKLTADARRKRNGKEDLRDHAASQAAARIRGHAYREKQRAEVAYDAAASLAKLAGKQAAKESKKRSSAVTRLQAVARSRYTRQHAKQEQELKQRQLEAAALIQAISRGKKARAEFNDGEERSKLEKRLGDRQQKSASVIQKHARRKRALRDVEMQRAELRTAAAKRLQRSARRHKPKPAHVPCRTSHNTKLKTPAQIKAAALGTAGEWRDLAGLKERSRDIEIARHMGFMFQESCDYREHWRRVLASPFYPDAAHLRRRISIVKAQTPRCTDAEAFAGLAVSRGDISGAVQQLAQGAFRSEIKLVYAMFDLTAVVRAASFGEQLPASLTATKRRATKEAGPASPRRLAPITSRSRKDELTAKLLGETASADALRDSKRVSPKAKRKGTHLFGRW